MYRKRKIILFFIYSHDKFLALSLLNPLEKNPGVITNFNNHYGSYGVNKKIWTLQNKFIRIHTS